MFYKFLWFQVQGESLGLVLHRSSFASPTRKPHDLPTARFPGGEASDTKRPIVPDSSRDARPIVPFVASEGSLNF